MTRLRRLLLPQLRVSDVFGSICVPLRPLATFIELSPSKPGSLAPIYSFLANVHIFRARQAPKLILPNPRTVFPYLVSYRDTETLLGQDDMTSQKTKEEHYKEAAMCINASDNALRQSESDGGVLFLLARGILPTVSFSTSLLTRVGIHQMSTRSMDDALRCFDAVLLKHPTNVIALLGKVHTLRVHNHSTNP